jgi:hypothetical protein
MSLFYPDKSILESLARLGFGQDRSPLVSNDGEEKGSSREVGSSIFGYRMIMIIRREG